MQPDAETLRELISQLDPENPLGKKSENKVAMEVRRQNAESRRLDKQLKVTHEQIKALERLGKPVPERLRHFLHHRERHPGHISKFRAY